MWMHQRIAVSPTPMTNEANAIPTVTSVETPTRITCWLPGCPLLVRSEPGDVVVSPAALISINCKFPFSYTIWNSFWIANKRTVVLYGESGLGYHTQWSSNQNLLRCRNRFIEERFEYVPSATVLRGIDTLKEKREIRSRNEIIEDFRFTTWWNVRGANTERERAEFSRRR